MVRIRLRREGKKRQPSYRIVVADREAPRDGRFLEIVGHYNPRTEPATIVVKEDRVYHWIMNGAQPSDSVNQLFRRIGALDRIKRYKAGEDLETLLKEAEAARVDVDPRTRRDEDFSAPKAPAAKEEPVVEKTPVVEDAPVEEEEEVAEEDSESTEEE